VFQMKIAIIQNVTINDHRSVYNDGIARYMVKKGHKVDLILQKSNEVSQFESTSYNIKEINGGTYSIWGQIKFIVGSFRLFLKEKYDIVHCKNPFSSLIAILILKKIGVVRSKIIYDIRGLWIAFGVHAGYYPKILGKILTKIEIFFMKRCDAIIFISAELQKEYIYRGYKKDKITSVIAEGTDFKKISTLKKENIKERFSINGKVIGYLGTISKARESEKIIESFDHIRKKTDNVSLIMIGPIAPKEEDHFCSIIKEKSLEKKVFFTGFIPIHDNAVRYLKSCDVAVSYHEKDLPIYNVAVPIKILEYLALGLPIVVPKHKMYTNVLTHGKDAYITGKNPKSFAKGIMKVLTNEDLARKLSQNARKTAEKYDFEKIAEKVMDVYEG